MSEDWGRCIEALLLAEQKEVNAKGVGQEVLLGFQL